ncbi:TIGR02594 family protein [Polaromonas sp.]|uniref:TIGR02594 family protein n=1 Tax=Polaromonas sp. TaxID=1869339 RepID=UPI0037525504
MKHLAMFVTADTLHVRKDPGGESLGFVHRGSELSATEIDATGCWAKVSGPAINGWCHLKHLMPVGADVPPWLAIAQREVGVKELPGSGHHPRILQYMATVDNLSGNNASKDETAWCSCFMNWCMEASGYIGTNSAMALSWNQWRNGKPPDPDKARLGDIAVGERVSAKSGYGHVAIFVAYDPEKKRLLLLGGNQDNAVRYSWYPIAQTKPYGKLLGFRSL